MPVAQSGLSLLRRCLLPRLPAIPPLPCVAAPLRAMGTGFSVGRPAAAVAAAGAAAEPAASPAAGLASLENLKWDNVFTKELPGDDKEENRVRQVHGALYSFVSPTPTGTNPTTVIASPGVARLVGLDPAELSRPEFAAVFSGNAGLPGTRPYAQCYGGHQFGSWAGQLGDGRAICLGQALGPDGRRWELQLKGAGKTPYSRFADGRAVLRSSLREYVASEAMAALGVPTTRALSLVATGDGVVRDMFYSGNPQVEPGAVVCRVAPCFVRFGTFQLPVSRGEEQAGLAGKLAEYVVRHHFPHLQGRADAAAALFGEVCSRTARVVADWQRVGFVHGVLNTDNMSIIGDTIDYGPYGWLERFDPDFTPNTTDLPGRRYSYRAQPEVGQFNLIQLAQALVAAGLMNEDEARAGLEAYAEGLATRHEAGVAAKLGLKAYDRELSLGLMRLMYEDSSDFTNTYRALGHVPTSPAGDEPATGLPPALAAAIEAPSLTPDRLAAWRDWLALYRARVVEEGVPEAERQARQRGASPAIVPRNHVLVDIIGHAEEGDYEPLHSYMAALLKPYEEEGLDPRWLAPGPRQPRMGVELLSCSS